MELERERRAQADNGVGNTMQRVGGGCYALAA